VFDPVLQTQQECGAQKYADHGVFKNVLTVIRLGR